MESTRTVVDRPNELLGLVGHTLGTSPWFDITQEDVDDFARITRDYQWIHIDRERAAAGPFGGTIAHGFYVLSLCAYLTEETLETRSQSMGINYGLDRVRFTAPVPIPSRIRAHVELESASERDDGGVHFVLKATIEVEGQEKPACVALLVSRVYE